MVITDTIGDMLNTIKNGSLVGKSNVKISHSKLNLNILKVLKQYKFIKDYIVEKDKTNEKFNIIKVFLYKNRNVMFKRISKPGRRLYTPYTDLKMVKSGLGISILSTSKGIMSNVDAYNNKLGGEILCVIF